MRVEKLLKPGLARVPHMFEEKREAVMAIEAAVLPWLPRAFSCG